MRGAAAPLRGHGGRPCRALSRARAPIGHRRMCDASRSVLTLRTPGLCAHRMGDYPAPPSSGAPWGGGMRSGQGNRRLGRRNAEIQDRGSRALRSRRRSRAPRALTPRAAPPEARTPRSRRPSRRAAQRGRGEAARAAGGRAQAGHRRQGEADQARRQHRGQARVERPRRRRPVRRARAREDRQDLRRARRVRRRAAPELPGPGHQQEHPRPDDVERAAAQQDPGARPREGQLDRLAGGLQPRALPAAVLRQGRGRRVAQDLLRAPVLRPLQRRRHRHRLGEGPRTTRRATAAATASRARPTCARTRGR